MKLTRYERQVLANQYEILSKLDPASASYHAPKIEALIHGYEREYDDCIDAYDEGVSEDICNEVRDILEMFRWAHWGLRDHPDLPKELRRRLTFDGFDGNEESAHFVYAKFVHEQQGLWAEQKGVNFNSHVQRLYRYRRMVAEWKQLGGRSGADPTAAELEQVASADS